MFKKLDILIIKSFIGPFVVTFFISLFVLVMQFFWLYMDELIGKGLSIWTIVQLLMYMSATLVPLALPLSILLASIMTFGDLGENFELVAIKSAGISLLRFMRPMMVFVGGITLLAFLFNNNAIPVANLKALSLLYDVRNSKPTLNIKPDQFNNDLQGYAIRVGSKDEDGFTIHDILIYDHSDPYGNNKVVVAKQGKMIPTADKRALIFRLEDGWRYEEQYEHGTHATGLPQVRMHFARWDKVFMLPEFTRTNQDLFKNAILMMDAWQLHETIDSMGKKKDQGVKAVNSYMSPYLTIANKLKEDTLLNKKIATVAAGPIKYNKDFLEVVPAEKRGSMMQTVSNNLRNLKSLMDNNCLNEKLQQDNYIKFSVEFHRKFALSFACFLLFLIGAPLGAIIRKGGLGLPLVFAVFFFITFHILNITGEKLAKSGAVPPWLGMWMSSLLLMPIAVWLVNTARNDSQLLNKELYVRLWRRIKGYFVKKDKAFAR